MLAWARGGYSPCSLLRRCAWLRSRSRALALRCAWCSAESVGSGGMSEYPRLTRGISGGRRDPITGTSQHGHANAPRKPVEEGNTAGAWIGSQKVMPPLNRVLGHFSGWLPYEGLHPSGVTRSDPPPEFPCPLSSYVQRQEHRWPARAQCSPPGRAGVPRGMLSPIRPGAAPQDRAAWAVASVCPCRTRAGAGTGAWDGKPHDGAQTRAERWGMCRAHGRCWRGEGRRRW